MVVTRKDRLCRFGSELVEWIFEKNGTRLVVLGSDVYTNDSEAGELAEDLLAIVTVFVAQHNGLRSAANRRRRRDAAQEFQEGSEETFVTCAWKAETSVVRYEWTSRRARWKTS